MNDYHKFKQSTTPCLLQEPNGYVLNFSRILQSYSLSDCYAIKGEQTFSFTCTYGCAFLVLPRSVSFLIMSFTPGLRECYDTWKKARSAADNITRYS